MPIKYIRSVAPVELREPFRWREESVNDLITARALLAVADGRVEAIERREAAHYINPRRLAPTISEERITELFDDRVRRFKDGDFSDLIATSDVFRAHPGSVGP